MNRFMVVLKGKLNDDIRSYFNKRGVLITFDDELIPELFICETKLDRSELESMQFVEEVKVPRKGSLEREELYGEN